MPNFGTFTRNGVEYAHTSATATLTPRVGINAGIPLTLSAVSSIKFELGAGSEAMHGTSSAAPETLVPTEAKPTWELGLSRLTQSRAVANHLGPGGSTILCDLVLTWQRLGQKALTDYIDGAMVTKGLGVDSASGNGPKDSIGGNCTNCRPGGVDLLTPIL